MVDLMRKQVFEKNTEIIAAFFTNRCYNDIYSIAKDYFAKNGGRSLSEVYANLLFAHLHEIETSHPGSDGVIRETIKNLHVYYCEFLGEVALDDFINRIVAQIVPEEFFSSMGMRDCDAILRDIVKQTALAVGKRALKKDMMHYIIDVRTDTIGVGILRDMGITVLRDFKSSLLAKLYAKKTGDDGSHGSGCRSIPFELYDKVRAELRRTIETYVELEAKYGKLEIALAKIKRENAQMRYALSRSGPQIAPVDHSVAPTGANEHREFTAPIENVLPEHRTETTVPATPDISHDTLPAYVLASEQIKKPVIATISPNAQTSRHVSDVVVDSGSSSSMVNDTVRDAPRPAIARHSEPPPMGSAFGDASRREETEGDGVISDFHGDEDGDGDGDEDVHVDVAKLSRDIASRNKLTSAQ